MTKIDEISMTILEVDELYEFCENMKLHKFSEKRKEEVIIKLDEIINSINNNWGEKFKVNITHLLEDKKELNACIEEETNIQTQEGFYSALNHIKEDILRLTGELNLLKKDF